MATTRLTKDFVPTSYDELFAYYYGYVLKMVNHLGIDPDNTEDVAMTILTKFLEKDALSDFDPDHVSVYAGVTRKAVFRTFLSGFVATYVKHHRDRQNKLAYREGTTIDREVTNGSGWSPSGRPAEWMEIYGPAYVEEYEDLAEHDLIQSIRKQLANFKPRNGQDKCPMPEFFEAVLRQTRASGRVDLAVLAAEFDVSVTSIQNWMKRLRVEVNVVVEMS